jgi:hypothetical protein
MPVKARAGGQGRVRGGRVGAQQGTGGTPSPPAPDPSFGTASGVATVSGIGGTVAAGSTADWFVDSVAGSDANNGTAQATPFATLAAVSTAVGVNPTKTTVSLKRGSLFRESLPAAVTSCTDYGTGNLPIVDGSDVITGWTVNGTNAAVWEKTLTIDTGGRPRIFEDGILMPWVADLATCSITAGSRVLLNDGGTVTLQMHPTGGGNPNSNGKTYEATVRASPVIMGDNCSLIGVHARRAISNNGAIEMGLNAIVQRCLAIDGSKHNILVGSGTLTDVIAARTDAVTPAEPSQTYIVGFTNDAAGKSLVFTRCGTISDAGGTKVGISLISHDNVAHTYDSISGTQLWAVDVGTAYSASANGISIQGLFVDNASSPLGGCFAAQVTLDYVQAHNTGVNSDMGSSITNTAALTPAFWKIRDSVFYSEGSTNNQIREAAAMDGMALTLQHVTSYTNADSRGLTGGEGWSSGTFNFNGCITYANTYGCSIEAPTGVTYVADNNAFCTFNSSTSIWNTYHGTLHTTFAPFKAATGQDANSITYDPASGVPFSGTPSAGDFRLSGSGVGASATALGAGPQNHWNWNTRTAVSGPPSAWPIVPRTLADAITYMSNPTAWSW